MFSDYQNKWNPLKIAILNLQIILKHFENPVLKPLFQYIFPSIVYSFFCIVSTIYFVFAKHCKMRYNFIQHSLNTNLLKTYYLLDSVSSADLHNSEQTIPDCCPNKLRI